MNALPFLGSFSAPALFAWQSLVSFVAFPFRHFAPGGMPRTNSRRGMAYARLHASFLLVVAVLLACVILAPTAAGAPLFNPKNAGFVYLQQSPGGAQQLRLGVLDTIAPKPRAHQIATLEDVDGNYQTIYGLSARNDNRYVAVYVFEDGSVIGDAFLDHNIKIYAMHTGAAIGLINEHSFSVLNRATLPSVRLQEFLDEQIAMGDLDAGTAALFDYYVDTEALDIMPPVYRWNQDKTISVTFTLAVMAYLGSESEAAYIGDETFTRTYAVGTNLEFVDWSLHAAAAPGNYFQLGPINSAEPQVVTFQNKVVTFHYPGFPGLWEGPRYAVRVEGKIPRTVVGVITAP
jgi:hypothetical protein